MFDGNGARAERSRSARGSAEAKGETSRREGTGEERAPRREHRIARRKSFQRKGTALAIKRTDHDDRGVTA